MSKNQDDLQISSQLVQKVLARPSYTDAFVDSLKSELAEKDAEIARLRLDVEGLEDAQDSYKEERDDALYEVARLRAEVGSKSQWATQMKKDLEATAASEAVIRESIRDMCKLLEDDYYELWEEAAHAGRIALSTPPSEAAARVQKLVETAEGVAEWLRSGLNFHNKFPGFLQALAAWRGEK